MKQGWKKKTFRDLLEKTDTINPLQYPEKVFDYIDVSSVSNISFTIEKTQKIKGKNAPSRARRLVRKNDVIFATVRPTLKRIAIIPDRLDNQICSTGYFVLRPTSEVNHRYLFYSLFCNDFIGNIERLQKGASYPAVTDKDIRNQVLTFPPLPEQQRIVDILDQSFTAIDQAIENTKRNLKNIQASFFNFLKNSINSPGEGRKQTTLQKICEIRSGNSLDLKIEKPHGELPYLKVADLNLPENLKQITTSSRFINKSDINLRNLIPIGSIIFPKRGGAIFTNKKRITTKEIWMDLNLMAVTPNDEILPLFLYYFFQNLDFRAFNNGSSIPQINNYDIFPLVICYPKEKNEQRKIIQKLELYENYSKRLESLFERKITLLQELKQSILHKAFHGEL